MFELDGVFIEEGCETTTLAERVMAKLPPAVPIRVVADGRQAARVDGAARDPFGQGKRRLIILPRRGDFLMACPAGSSRFACCGYMVLALASNCPMDCSYCFLQEYLADNPGFQVYANYHDAFDEIGRLLHGGSERRFRIGTGELADSLAFDGLTGLSLDLIDFFARHERLTLELKTKTDEIDNLLARDPRGRVMVSWTLSPPRVYRSSEHRTAPPEARISAAARVAAAGYRVAFHLDPIIAYQGAERDYALLIEMLADTFGRRRPAFVSMGGLRMTPRLLAAARRRYPRDPMLVGEEVLAPDGRLRTYIPRRAALYHAVKAALDRYWPDCPRYLCMETAAMSERVLGQAPLKPADLSGQLTLS